MVIKGKIISPSFSFFPQFLRTYERKWSFKCLSWKYNFLSLLHNLMNLSWYIQLTVTKNNSRFFCHYVYMSNKYPLTFIKREDEEQPFLERIVVARKLFLCPKQTRMNNVRENYIRLLGFLFRFLWYIDGSISNILFRFLVKLIS